MRLLSLPVSHRRNWPKEGSEIFNRGSLVLEQIAKSANVIRYQLAKLYENIVENADSSS